MYGYYCPCTYEFSTVAARKWLVPVFAIQSTLFICVLQILILIADVD